MAENGVEVVEVTPRHVDEFKVELMGEFPSALAHYLASEPTAPADAFDQITQEDPRAGAEKPDTRAYRHALATRGL